MTNLQLFTLLWLSGLSLLTAAIWIYGARTTARLEQRIAASQRLLALANPPTNDRVQ